MCGAGQQRSVSSCATVLASALQRLPIEQRWDIARGLLSHAEDADDHNLPLMIWYGIEPLASADTGRFMRLAARGEIPTVRRFAVRRAASNVGELEPVMATFESVTESSDRAIVLDEMLRAFQGRVGLTMPRGLGTSLRNAANGQRRRVRELADEVAVKFGDRRIFGTLREQVADDKGDIDARRRALAILIDGKDSESLPLLLGLLNEPRLRSRCAGWTGATQRPVGGTRNRRCLRAFQCRRSPPCARDAGGPAGIGDSATYGDYATAAFRARKSAL